MQDQQIEVPAKAKTLTKEELLKQKAERKKQNLTKWTPPGSQALTKEQKKANRKKMKASRKSAFTDEFPYSVTIRDVEVLERYEIRAWFVENSLRTLDSEHVSADVTWDDSWKVFRFRDEAHSVFFNLRFGR